MKTHARSLLGLLALGAAAFALMACDAASADDEDATEAPPAATAPSDPTATPGGGGGQPGGGSSTPDGGSTPGSGDTPVTPGDPAHQPSPAPSDPPYATEVVPAPIESVDVVVRESFPPQYAAVVVSGLPSGCAAFHSIKVERDGDVFDITVLNTMPAPNEQVMCTMIYGMVEHTVELEGQFESGKEYRVVVNGETETSFIAQ